MSCELTLTPKNGGPATTITNIISCHWGAGRPAAPNGYLGMENYGLRTLVISRHRSLKVDGKTALDLEAIKLFAAQGEDAYFDGVLKYYSADDNQQPCLVQRFTAHITDWDQHWSHDGFTDTWEITPIQFEVGDEVFKRPYTG